MAIITVKFALSSQFRSRYRIEISNFEKYMDTFQYWQKSNNINISPITTVNSRGHSYTGSVSAVYRAAPSADYADFCLAIWQPFERTNSVVYRHGTGWCLVFILDSYRFFCGLPDTLTTAVNLRCWCVQSDVKCTLCDSTCPITAHNLGGFPVLL